MEPEKIEFQGIINLKLFLSRDSGANLIEQKTEQTKSKRKMQDPTMTQKPLLDTQTWLTFKVRVQNK